MVQNFTDFALCEVSHLGREAIRMIHTLAGRSEARKQAREVLKDAFEFGKHAIDIETNKGDLIIIETPEIFTFEDFAYLSGDVDRQILEQQWADYERENTSLYKRLAEYAKQKGRRIQSSKSGLFADRSKLRKKFEKLPQSSEKRKRFEYLLQGPRQDIHVLRMIQSKEPKLVIMAAGHIAVINAIIKPRRVLIPKLSTLHDKLKVEEYLRAKRGQWLDHQKEKGVRRRLAMEELKKGKKLTKTSPENKRKPK